MEAWHGVYQGEAMDAKAPFACVIQRENETLLNI
jgi:hypothetical protein